MVYFSEKKIPPRRPGHPRPDRSTRSATQPPSPASAALAPGRLYNPANASFERFLPKYLSFAICTPYGLYTFYGSRPGIYGKYTYKYMYRCRAGPACTRTPPAVQSRLYNHAIASFKIPCICNMYAIRSVHILWIPAGIYGKYTY